MSPRSTLLGFLTALLALSVLLLPSTAWGEPLDLDLAIEFQGRARHYLVHVPDQASRKQPMPVIVNFHGGGGSALAHKRRVRMEPLADREGVILVFPDGYQARQLRRRALLTWNAGNCCGPAQKDDSDDTGFVLAVLEHLASRFPVDPTRIYATGFSNGAMMSYAVALELPQRFAAIAPVSGANDTPPPATIARMPLMHVHSVNDPRALYEGGLGPPFPMSETRIQHPGVENVVARWAAHNGCSPQTELRETLRTEDGHTATLVSYAGCPSDGPVELWKLTGAGHVWPGSASPRQKVEGTGPETQVLDANERVWAFFKRHRRPNAPVLGRNPPPSSEAQPEADADSEVADSLEVSFNRGAFGARFGVSTSRPRDESSSAPLREAVLDLRLAIPLFSRFTLSREQREGWFVLANLSALGYLPNDVLIGESQRFYRFGAGVSGAYLSSSSNLYGIYLGARIAESEETLSDPNLLPLVLGLGTYRFGDDLALLYGAGFAYTFGQGLPMAYIGLNWDMSSRWRLSVLLPAFAYLQYAINDDWRLSFGPALNGDTFGYERLDASGVAEHVRLRISHLRLLARASYGRRQDPQWWLAAGVQGQRVDPSREDDADETTYGGVYAETGLTLPFGP